MTIEPPASDAASLSVSSICQGCGACCGYFRVSFYWAEAEVHGIPAGLVERLSPHLACLAGTNQSAMRCQALEGRIGERVACSIYANRPSPCRELQLGDEKCTRARARYGLPPYAAETRMAKVAT